MTRLPNLELLMHKAIGHLGLDKKFMEKVIKAKSDGIRTFNFQIETFPQIWGEHLYRVRHYRGRKGCFRWQCFDYGIYDRCT